MATEIAANRSLPGLPTTASGPGYARRHPEETDQHSVVREQLETFLARVRERDRPVPRFVEREFRAYLECGILAHGFLRLHCDDCHLDRLVPFSCKQRGFCPSCGGRRMADTAAHLVDCVLPEVPIRQWVLTLPYPLRYRCAYGATLTSQVLRAFLRALFAALRRRAREEWSRARGQCGVVTFIQRFGSALNLNVHFHTLALDGVYTRDDGTATHFLPIPPPTADEIARVLAGTARRIARLLASRAEGDDDALARDEPLLATLAAASLRARVATGPHAGQRWRRLGDRVEPGDSDADLDASPRVPQHDGMSLHAEVAVPARDRRRLERLCRYVARPPLAHDRLEVRPDRTARPASQDPLARRHNAHPDGAPRAAGAARPPHPPASSPPGSLPRRTGALRQLPRSNRTQTAAASSAGRARGEAADARGEPRAGCNAAMGLDRMPHRQLHVRRSRPGGKCEQPCRPPCRRSTHGHGPA